MIAEPHSLRFTIFQSPAASRRVPENFDDHDKSTGEAGLVRSKPRPGEHHPAFTGT